MFYGDSNILIETSALSGSKTQTMKTNPLDNTDCCNTFYRFLITFLKFLMLLEYCVKQVTTFFK
jgi:hypothetical protein